MTVKIYPGKLKGAVAAPPSKSMAHRHIIAAAFSEGKSRLSNIGVSDDIRATLHCVSALGAKVALPNPNAKHTEITGIDIFSFSPKRELSAGESGSTLRFLIPLCLLTGKTVVFTGEKRLFERPLEVYEKLCAAQGCYYQKKPLSLTVRGVLKPGVYEVPGGITSQFISGLLFALPFLDGDSRINITGKPESAPYVSMTLQVLGEYGIEAGFESPGVVAVPGNQSYKSRDATIEGDYSGSAFFEALNLLGNEVTVTGLSEDSLQGDKIYKTLFAHLGKESVSLENCPDLAPVLFALAADLGGGEFTGTRRLKIKESDRANAMAAELAKFGARLLVRENSVVVENTPLHPPKTVLKSHGDHRIAMALSVLCVKYGGTIEGAEAVSKSMPDFYEKLTSLGAAVEKPSPQEPPKKRKDL